jgi:multicomponent Na+:H+ antiporter subunit G
MADWIAAVLIVAGAGFCFAAGVGVLRFRDAYQRMHAASKAGTLGLALVCLAAMVQADGAAGVVEPLLVFVFTLATAPVAAHLIGRAAFRTGSPEEPGTRHDPGTERFRAGGNSGGSA